MKVTMEHLLVSGNEDGKGAVRTALESVHAELVKPKVEDAVFKEAIELVDAVTEVHKDNYEVKTAAGELLKQLVIAQGIPQETVSQEGLGELLTKVKNVLTGRDKHGVKPSDAKPGTQLNAEKWWGKEGDKALEELKKAITKFYLNDNWLKGQTFVEGNVSAEDIAEKFVIKGKVPEDLEKAARENIDNLVKLGKTFGKAGNKYSEKIAALDDELVKLTENLNPDNEDDVKKVDDLLNTYINKVNALPTPTLAGAPTQFLGGIELFVGKQGLVQYKVEKAKSIPSELPALDANGVKAMARLMLDLLEAWKLQYGDDWYVTGSYEDDGATLREFYDYSNNMDEYYDITYYQALWDDLHGASSEAFNHNYYLVVALERYIDRSIK